MKNFTFDELVDTWIEYYQYDSNSKEAEERFWALETYMDWTIDEKHEELWRFTLEVLKREPSPELMNILAAGPLEDLMQDYGPLYIDRVEKEARTHVKFRKLLAGVWKADIKDDIWKRMQKFLR